MVGSYWVCHWKKTFWVGGFDGIGGLTYLLFCAGYWSRQLRVSGGVGALPLWESVGMRRSFAPHFRHLDDLFAPQNLTMSTILFRSCWVPFRSPTFSACRPSFCPPNWPNRSFYSDLVGSRFELQAAHPYWFCPECRPPTPTPPGEGISAFKPLLFRFLSIC